MTDRDTDPIAALSSLTADTAPDDLMARIAADAALEQAFHQARAEPSQPSELLMARIARDAKRHRPRHGSAAGAWTALVAAGLAGLMIGMSGLLPDALQLAQSDYSLSPSYEFQLLDEE